MPESEITREEILAQYNSGPLLLDAALAGLSGSDIEAIALFHANRRQVMQLLHDLPDAWERYVLYSRAGIYDKAKMTVGDIIESQAHHALAHVEDISTTRRMCKRRD
jgi:hypothetical protein